VVNLCELLLCVYELCVCVRACVRACVHACVCVCVVCVYIVHLKLCVVSSCTGNDLEYFICKLTAHHYIFQTVSFT